MGEPAIKIEPGLCQFEIKKAGKKQLEIEGFANRFQVGGKEIVDRGGDTIMPDAWDLESFKKNPIIFFQHDRDFIVGRATEIGVEEDGLRIKVAISNSSHPEVAHIRTLIEEGTLKSFSVGINIRDEEVDEMGVNRIKECELLEVSLVSIPMNQESFFSISNKAWEATHRLSHFDDILEEKGAWLASRIHNRIFEMAKNSESFNRAEALQQIAEAAGSSSEELFEILAGNVTDVDDEFLEAFSSVLDLNKEELEELNQADVEIEGEIVPDEAEEEEEEEEEDGEEGPEDEREGGEDAQQEQEEEESEAAIGDQEEPEAEENETEETGETDPEADDEEHVSGRGDGDQLEDPMLDDDDESDESQLLPEDEEEEDKKPKKKQDVNTEEFKRCVSATIREAMDAGKDQDQALAFALEKCRKETGKCSLMPTDWSDIYGDIEKYQAEKLTRAAQAKAAKPKPEKKVRGKKKPAPKKNKTQPLGTTVASDMDQGNEFMAVAKQTNILLAQMVGELQKLQQIILDQTQAEDVQNGVEDQALPDPVLPEGAPMSPSGATISTPNTLLSDSDIPKQLDIIQSYKKKLNQKFATHGV